jgi:uncharacterized protein YuzE
MMELGRVTYDAEADALYVRLVSRPVAKTIAKGDLRMVDYADDDTLIGVEFLGASGGIGLRDLPDPDKIEKLLGQNGLHFKILV